MKMISRARGTTNSTTTTAATTTAAAVTPPYTSHRTPPKDAVRSLSSLEVGDRALFDTLVAWRKAIAKDLRLSSKYVCALVTLRYLVQAKPTSIKDMYGIAGIPHEFIVLWGTELLPIFERHQAATGTFSRTGNTPATDSDTVTGGGLLIPKKPRDVLALSMAAAGGRMDSVVRMRAPASASEGAVRLHELAEDLRQSSEKYSNYSIPHWSLSEDQKVITDFMLDTNKHIFLTGSTYYKAYPPKSSNNSSRNGGRKYVLRYLLQEWSFRYLQRLQSERRMRADGDGRGAETGNYRSDICVDACSGIDVNVDVDDTVVTSCCDAGSLLLGGESIFKFARIRATDTNPDVVFRRIMAKPALASRWLRMSRLVIDDVNLLPAHVFALLEHTARLVRNTSTHFGGIQVVCCGDFLSTGPPAPGYIYDSSAVATGLDTGRGRLPTRQTQRAGAGIGIGIDGFEFKGVISKGDNDAGDHTSKRSTSSASSAVDLELLRVSRQWCFETELWSQMHLDRPVVISPLTRKDGGEGVGGLKIVEWSDNSSESSHGVAVHLDMLGSELGDSGSGSCNDSGTHSNVRRESESEFVSVLAAVRIGRTSEHLLHGLSACSSMFKPLPQDGIRPIQLRKCVCVCVCVFIGNCLISARVYVCMCVCLVMCRFELQNERGA